MKKFEVPMMMMVRLPQNDVIATSYCESQVCFGYVCPDCPTICTGVYTCDIFKCTTYEG